jgi:exopolysaccharide biosynthesis polyprenyl glycosylphosphotransferase
MSGEKNKLKSVVERVSPQQIVIIALMLVPDFLAILAAAFTAYVTRFANPQEAIGNLPSLAQFEYRGVLAAISLAWIGLLILTGTYRFNHATLVVFNLRMIIRRSFAFFFFLGFLSFILKASFSRSVFLMMLASGLIYLFLVRITIYFLFLRPMILGKKVTSKMMIIGRDKTAIEEHTDWLMKNRKLGFSVVARMACPEITSKWVDEFDRLLRHNIITEVLLLPGMETDPNFSKFIHYLEDLNIHVNWIPLDSGNLGYWLIPSSQEGIPFLTFEKSQISFLNRVVKRSFDLVFAVVIMILLSPLFLIISLAVLITSGRPIFYSQRRIGLNGKPFKFYKFRSMVKNADQIVHEVENVHGNSHVLFKNPVDPRITPVGRILRKYSLDELPQFLNVLNNSMSIVGPRPALPREVNVYNSIYERRLIAKPGITGPWQISGRSDLDLRTSVALDLNYLINWSFTRDLWIIIATVGEVFRGRGAY